MSEVSDLLRAEGIPESMLTDLAGTQYTACTGYMYMYDNYTPSTDNHIDGIALVGLPEDFEEFKYLILSSGFRMRIKTLIKNWCSSGGIHGATEVKYISTSMCA